MPCLMMLFLLAPGTDKSSRPELILQCSPDGQRVQLENNTRSGGSLPINTAHDACPLQVNLRYGVQGPATRTGTETDTCTACAGTIILEFAALSRFTGDPVFEVRIGR